MNHITFNKQHIPCVEWAIKHGCIGNLISYDCETSMINLTTQSVPDFVIGSAYNGQQAFLITKDRLEHFFKLHNSSVILMTNASFDLAVLAKTTKIDIYKLIESELIIDILLLDNLNNIAEFGAHIPKTRLDLIVKKHLGVDLPKNIEDENCDSIRTSFGSFILPDGEIAYSKISFKYLEYALKDAIATFIVGQAIAKKSIQLCTKFKVSREQLLSHHLQLKAAYALSVVSRNGHPIDHEKKAVIVDYLESQISNLLDDLYGGEVFLILSETIEAADEKSSARLPAIALVGHDFYLYDTCGQRVNLSAYSEILEKKLSASKFTKDPTRKSLVKYEICNILSSHNVPFTFAKYGGWKPGAGSDRKLQDILSRLESDFDISLPKTSKSGLISSKGEDLEALVESLEGLDFECSFIETLLSYKEKSKLLEFIRSDADALHPRFNTIVSTGRTSSYHPNCQNFPRDTEACSVRNIVKAIPYHVILSADFKQIELVALAQTNFNRGNLPCVMKDMINDHIDLHKLIVSKIENKPIDSVTDEEKKKGKPINFGFPGGLGIKKFIKYAWVTYQQRFSVEEAQMFKNIWLDTFPEIRVYLSENNLEKLEASGLLKDYTALTKKNSDYSKYVFNGIINGNYETKTTYRKYTIEEINWAFSILKRVDFPNKEKFQSAIQKLHGSRDLAESFFRRFNCVILPSGRVRNYTTYCQTRNTPFQGLAADGAKLALYELIKAGYKVFNFIHDEFLIMVPLDSDLEMVSKDIQAILINNMKIYCPDVDVRVNLDWMFNWAKNGTHILIDGKLIHKNQL